MSIKPEIVRETRGCPSGGVGGEAAAGRSAQTASEIVARTADARAAIPADRELAFPARETESMNMVDADLAFSFVLKHDFDRINIQVLVRLLGKFNRKVRETRVRLFIYHFLNEGQYEKLIWFLAEANLHDLKYLPEENRLSIYDEMIKYYYDHFAQLSKKMSKFILDLCSNMKRDMEDGAIANSVSEGPAPRSPTDEARIKRLRYVDGRQYQVDMAVERSDIEKMAKVFADYKDGDVGKAVFEAGIDLGAESSMSFAVACKKLSRPGILQGFARRIGRVLGMKRRVSNEEVAAIAKGLDIVDLDACEEEGMYGMPRLCPMGPKEKTSPDERQDICAGMIGGMKHLDLASCQVLDELREILDRQVKESKEADISGKLLISLQMIFAILQAQGQKFLLYFFFGWNGGRDKSFWTIFCEANEKLRATKLHLNMEIASAGTEAERTQKRSALDDIREIDLSAQISSLEQLRMYYADRANIEKEIDDPQIVHRIYDNLKIVKAASSL